MPEALWSLGLRRRAGVSSASRTGCVPGKGVESWLWVRLGFFQASGMTLAGLSTAEWGLAANASRVCTPTEDLYESALSEGDRVRWPGNGFGHGRAHGPREDWRTDERDESTDDRDDHSGG